MTCAPLRERGASLIVALIFLVIMAMLGVTVAGVTSLEQRMASNTRDRDLALQSAEAALHDAEERLKGDTWRNGLLIGYDATRENSASYWETCFAGTSGPCATKYTPATGMLEAGAGAVASQPQFVVEKKNPIGLTQVYLVTARAVGGTSDAIVVLQAEYDFTPAP